MNINASIIDQQVRGLAQRLRAALEAALGRPLDDIRARSVAFVLLTLKVLLDLTEDEALDALTEGGNDFGVDALVVGDVRDGEFTVTLVQGKYNHENLEGVKGFPQAGVEKAIQAVRSLFDPSAPLHLNPALQAPIEEVRSLILDGNIPRVRFLLANNGAPWKHPEAQALIDRERFGDRVRFEHVNHDTLVRILQSTAPVKDTLHFAGKALVEDLNYARVFVGKIPVRELARLMDTHGDRLLERNIRRYLGLHGNRVNEAIAATLRSPDERPNFYFYNNGITLICDRFDYNALQTENHRVRVEGLQVINGGQTSKTIQATLGESRQLHLGEPASDGFDTTYVLVRLYQVPQDARALVQTITYATNSQNPVDLFDLRSGDDLQRGLELAIRDLGFTYRRQRSDSSTSPTDITVQQAADAVLAIWRRHPHQVRFHRSELFGKLYDQIFTKDLSGAQLITGVLLLRIAEAKRRRPPEGTPDLVHFATYFVAMLMGEYLLRDLGIPLARLDHRQFDAARRLVDERTDAYYHRAIDAISTALTALYGAQDLPLQRLSATFRRGDLLPLLTTTR